MEIEGASKPSGVQFSRDELLVALRSINQTKRQIEQNSQNLRQLCEAGFQNQVAECFQQVFKEMYAA